MREIKFRAWDKEDKVMIEWEELKDNMDLGKLLCNEYEQYDEYEVVQYTGLKDKNDVEIYEGDIVKVTDDEGETNFVDGGIGSVGNMGDLFMWYIDGQVQNGLYEIECSCYIEVIGNIYENPELLEVSK